MKDNHQLVECLSDHEWDEFIKSSPQCNAFSLSSFVNALNVDYRRYLFAIDDDVVASILILKPGDVDFSAPYPYTQYQGLAFSETSLTGPSKISFHLRVTQSLLQHLNSAYPSHSLCLHPSVTDIRAFQWYNYHNQAENRYSYDLLYTGLIAVSEHSSFSKYLTTIRTARRQNYKRAQKLGISLSCENLVSDFIRLYALTFARQNIQISSTKLAYIEDMVLHLLNSGTARMFSAIDQNSYVCSSVVIMSDPLCDYYLFGACDPEYRSYGLNTFLILESLKVSFEREKKYFDMCGINSPNRGDFKTSFNAVPRPFYSVSIFNPPF